jgi:hypothetical protein
MNQDEWAVTENRAILAPIVGRVGIVVMPTPRVSEPLVLFVIVACFCCVPALWAQASDSQSGDASQSWTATTETHSDGESLTRTVESHAQSGNRTLDNQSLQRRGSDGRFEPFQDIEKTTVRVDANTVRTTTRTFGRDADGAKTLVQITEEEKRTLPGGDSSVVRNTSSPDVDGKLQLVQRELAETKKVSKDVEETKTTVLAPSVNGGLAPSMKVEERRTSSANGTVESQKTTLFPDGTGRWQVSEVRQATTTPDGKNRSTDERVSRPDPDGKLGEVSRTVSKESVSTTGEKRNTVDTYSTDVPGSAPDGRLHLIERATTAERPNSTGAQATRTVQQRDANGSFGVVSVDTTKSDNANVVQVQIAPSQSPK